VDFKNGRYDNGSSNSNTGLDIDLSMGQVIYIECTDFIGSANVDMAQQHCRNLHVATGSGPWISLVIKNTLLSGTGLAFPWQTGGAQYITIGAGGSAGIMVSYPHVAR
jgi:hypothetical protein